MAEKGKNMPQPVRITLAIVLWGVILWILSLGHPVLAQVARALFLVFVLPSGIVEWLKYKGVVSENRSIPVKLLFMTGAALLWYYEYR